jgi:hypothetical protein
MFLLLIKFFIIWVVVNVLIGSTIWYIRSVIKTCWPNWWRQQIIDEWPGS